ncbi:ANTAR domain-containing protein [Stenotrophomonas sp.]|uniref:ANTAR domain-containing response regulator n=1 Tax=Stenotrophomonas sp. TaxID=69392 RepID=UPI0028B15F1E|nr:ANTAR domain-containing protein [Stenotrophomonas sp.]
MNAATILGSLRELQVMVLSPPCEVTDTLMLQLIRIGCSVRNCWPPPKQFDVAVDVIFTGIFQNRHHEEISSLVRSSAAGTTVVALVEYESPAVLSQIIELECHGVIILPLDAHRILPALVSARRISGEMLRITHRCGQLQERLDQQSTISRAKLVLMKRHDWGEEQAHAWLSQEAMKQRESISKVAQDVVRDSNPG